MKTRRRLARLRASGARLPARLLLLLCLCAMSCSLPWTSASRVERLLAEAAQLKSQPDLQMKRRAIALLKSPIVSKAEASDARTEFRILSLLGEIESEISAFGDAACHFNHALQHARQQKESSILADALNAAGLAAIRLNQFEEARAFGREAMALCETEGYSAGKARVIANEAEWHYAAGDRDLALEKYLRAQAIFAGLNLPKQAAEMQMNAGLVHSDKLDAESAFSAFNGALRSFEALSDARGRALTLLGIAHLKARLGESEGALALYGRTLKMIRDQGDRYWEASALNGIGLVYQSSGEQKTALAHYEQAREIFRSLGLKNEEAQAMLTAGLILEDRERAVGLFEDLLKLFQELRDRKLEAICWRELGALYAARDDKRAALDAYARALALFETTSNPRGKVITLNALSEAQRTFDLRAAAEQTLQTALALSRSSGNTTGERETLYQLARMEKEDGRLDKARMHIESAIALAEIERANAGVQALQASYFASIQNYFHLYIDLLMAPSQKAGGEALRGLAFEQSERARARSLLDELTRARADYLRWGDPVLIERLRQIQAEINRSEEERLQKQREEAAEPELTAISLKTTALFIERDQVEARLRDAAPADRASIEPRPAMLRDIQQLLDPDTLLLEYWLGEKRSWVWMITPTSIDSAALPGRATIEAAAQDFYAVLSTAPLPSGLSPEEYEKSYKEKGDALSRMILGPLAHKLTTRRMLLVTDGLLQRIPFQALPAPETRAPQPLMMRHEIVNLPSASVLVTLRQQRMRRQPPTKSIAVFADAVFEQDDLRFESGAAGHAQIAGGRTQSPPRRSTSPPRRLPRLYFTDEEARAIESVTTDLAPHITTGFAASREAIVDGRLNDYRILHFATHGDLNDEHPELSALIFSRFDRQRRPQSGYLRVHDIYNLKLRADLVVLSACQTALGKQIRGEGVISLSRGFMYAGSRQVLASLWNVEDSSTALLMKHFYWNLFKLGQPPAEALRHAQMALWQEPRTRAPYFWAGFILQGEYK